MRGKNFAEVVEAIKWALISKDVSLSDIDIITLMHEEENGK